MEDFGSIAAGVAAIAAVLVAIWQLRENRRAAREQHARTVWMEYLKVGLDNPDLGAPGSYGPELTSEQLRDGESRDAQRYLWFLNITLEACDYALLHLREPEWRETVEWQIAEHAGVLALTWDDWKSSFSPRLRDAVAEVLRNPSKYG